jgi:tetratricopeptide (TPR) repeat protein
MAGLIERMFEPGQLLQSALVRSLLDAAGSTELAPGATLGPFRIAAEIARGGMGIVYLACRADGEYEQEVAIKWLPRGQLDSTALQLFRHERQILAGLRHPHIARLLDGGHSEDGHLWFAMEHVEGEAVDRHAAAHSPGWRERVQLLLPIVDAVQFAHGRLLLHRDIKPDNVRVDADGRAKLLDFGIATLVADSTAQRAFTPAYASPEQRAGAVPQVASDIWQLGRLLEEVLQAAPAPRLPRDVSAVLAKAMATDPARRYATAAALHADLRRLLAFQPVGARPPGMVHRAHLLMQAYPLGSMATGLLLGAFVAVIVGFMLNLARQRDAAEQAREVAQAVNRFINEDFLPGADPVQHGNGDMRVAELMAGALDKVEQRLSGMPEVAGEINLSLGRSLSGLGHYDLAEVALGRAIARLGQVRGAGHVSVLEARLVQNQVRIGAQSIAQNEADLRVLRTEAVAALGPEADLIVDIDNQVARAAFLREDFALCTARYLALLKHNPAKKAGLRADTYMGLSLCESRLGHFESALEHARQARDLYITVNGAEHPFTLETHIAIETALVGLGRYDEAVALLRELQQQLTRRYGADHPTTLTVTHDLGFALSCAGHAEGADWLRLAAVNRGRTLGEQHPWRAMSLAVLGMALVHQGDTAGAAQALDQADAILQTPAAATPFVRAIVLENRADLALAQQRYAAAITLFDQAIAAAEPLYAPQHQRLTILQLGRGLALSQAGRRGEGHALLAAALDRLGESPDCRSYQIAQARTLLAHQK